MSESEPKKEEKTVKIEKAAEDARAQAHNGKPNSEKSLILPADHATKRPSIRAQYFR